jgi:hypothetical protein
VERERFFADLTGDVIRACRFTSVRELTRDIHAYLEERNGDPRPYGKAAPEEAQRVM